MGTAVKRHKLSIDVIVTLHVHHKIQQINTRYKILQKGRYNVFFVINFLFSFSIYYSPHSSSSISSSNFAPGIFLAFNYTIVSKISQLLKKITPTYFMCCLKIIFLAVNASNLIKMIPLEMKLKNAINKIYSLANFFYFLKKNDNYSKTAKY